MSKQQKRDLLLIVGLVLIASLSALCFYPRDVGIAVQVSVDGSVIATYPLHTARTVSVSGVGGENLLVIENGSARILEADCPDRLCEDMPKISHVGETIICLPHRVTVRVLGASEGADTMLYLPRTEEGSL